MQLMDASNATILKPLYEQALRDHHARSMWYSNPAFTVQGMKAIVCMLRTCRNMDSWRLAKKIEDAINSVGGERCLNAGN